MDKELLTALKHRKKGEDRLALLIKTLFMVGRQEDIYYAVTQPNFRNYLYKEYNIGIFYNNVESGFGFDDDKEEQLLKYEQEEIYRDMVSNDAKFKAILNVKGRYDEWKKAVDDEDNAAIQKMWKEYESEIHNEIYQDIAYQQQAKIDWELMTMPVSHGEEEYRSPEYAGQSRGYSEEELEILFGC